jgi:uncharacterized ion transporter superfamily protein YfcC
MFKKGKKRNRAMLSAYSIIMVLVILLGILSHVFPKAQFVAVEPEKGEADTSKTVESLTVETAPTSEPLSTVAVTTEEAANSKPSTEPATTKAEDDDVVVVEAPEVVGTKTEDVEAVETTESAGEKEAVTYTSLADCEEENGEGNCQIVNGSGVVGAKLYQILMSPILGFADAIDVAIFIMVLGGLLAIIARTKALETGVRVIVQKMHGKEIWLIPLLMFIFSILGTTYGFLEESVGFYVLLAATMYAAGMDPLVGAATILLGAGVGVLGSTINPFATGLVLSSLPEGTEANQGLVMLIAVVLWFTSYAIATFFVVHYAKKVIRDKGSTFLSLREQKLADAKYKSYAESAATEQVKLTGRQKVTLTLFGLTFLIMIIGFVPWHDFGVTIFDNFTGWLTGAQFGDWWFYEASLWFLIMAIIIAIVNRMGEHGFVDAFVDGADDMIGVILVIAVARGVSVLMNQTYFDNYIIYNAINALAALPEMAFVPLNYLLHVGLSFLVPSSSGLAVLSTPITTPVAAGLGYSVEVASMTIVAANGLVNLITPTCGAIMGGLALAKVDYSTWFKWAFKVVFTILVVNIAVLMLFSLI